jgi:hypothetical protein
VIADAGGLPAPGDILATPPTGFFPVAGLAPLPVATGGWGSPRGAGGEDRGAGRAVRRSVNVCGERR